MNDMQREFNYQTYARWAVGPLMTRSQWEAREDRIGEQCRTGTLPTNPAEWGVDMDAVRAAAATRTEPVPSFFNMPCIACAVGDEGTRATHTVTSGKGVGLASCAAHLDQTRAAVLRVSTTTQMISIQSLFAAN
jgi:hypothetical protein